MRSKTIEPTFHSTIQQIIALSHPIDLSHERQLTRQHLVHCSQDIIPEVERLRLSSTTASSLLGRSSKSKHLASASLVQLE